MLKVTILITTVLLIFSLTTATAQVKEESTKTVTLTANLNTTISLQLNNTDIVFDFTTLEHYKKGLGKKAGAYKTTGAVSSTANWKLSFKAQGDFNHADGGVMPLNNVGLSAKFTGSNTIENNAENNPLALSTEETVILGHNGHDSNAGDIHANSFTIFWEMGTKRGKMNKKSIFEQDLKKGAYSTKVEFIATEVL